MIPYKYKGKTTEKVVTNSGKLPACDRAELSI